MKQTNKIYPIRDEKGVILTYELYTKLSDGTILRLERNSRKELKAFENVGD